MEDVLTILLPGAVYALVVPLSMWCVFRSREREEARLDFSESFCVRAASGMERFFWSVTLFLLVCMIAAPVLLVIFEPTSLFIVVSIELGLAVGCFLPFLGAMHVRYHYFLVTGEGIEIRSFRHKRLVRFEEMAYQCVADELSLVVYDKDGIPLLGLDGMYVGYGRLCEILREKQIPPTTSPFPTEEMKAAAPYQRFLRHSSLRLGELCFMGFGVMLLLAALFCFGAYVDEQNAEAWLAAWICLAVSAVLFALGFIWHRRKAKLDRKSPQ